MNGGSQIHSLTNGSSANSNSGPESPNNNRVQYRHSLDMKHFEGGFQDTPTQVSSPSQHVIATPPKLQSSYSANDVPTMRTATNGISSATQASNSHAQQHLHNHNASLGRIPPNAMNNRLSREMTSNEGHAVREAQNGGGYQSIQSALHASAPPFGPALTQGISQAPMSAMTSPMSQQAYPVGYNFNPYNGMQMINMGMQNMQIGQPMYSPGNPYAYGNGMYSPQPQPAPRDSQARVIQQRRQHDGEGKSALTRLN